MQMFFDATGPLYDFLERHRTPICRTCDGVTPDCSNCSDVCTFDERWILAHLNELLRRAISICWRVERQIHRSCTARAATNISGIRAFRSGKLRELGFNICLGTDSLASNSILSLFAEMRELLQNGTVRYRREEILEMVTVNAARPSVRPTRSDRFGPASTRT